MLFIFYYNAYICYTIVSLPILILCCPCTIFFICYKKKQRKRERNLERNKINSESYEEGHQAIDIKLNSDII